LGVDLRSVVEVVVVIARGWEDELDAVAAHAVVTCEQGDAAPPVPTLHGGSVLLCTRTMIFIMFPGKPHITA
jgi:hypothetical protein